MSDLATLPTNRDEDWRYADPEWLAAADPAALAIWKDIVVAPGETRSKCLILGDAEQGVHRVRIHAGPGSRAELFAVISASDYTRLEVEVTLGEGAHFEFGGVTLGGGKAVQEFVTRTVHGPGASSSQIVRAVQWGQSVGNFLGRIEIPRDAQKVDAAQNFRAILLEKGATANAKPELEIFADDVKAAHGAAIGALDEQSAFYMASRGLPPEAARKLLVRAFIADAFVAIGDETERDAMLEAALSRLDEAAL